MCDEYTWKILVLNVLKLKLTDPLFPYIYVVINMNSSASDNSKWKHFCNKFRFSTFWN